ncbi:MAG TPA: alanine/ornithine racemase family PLP-dependent enzyme, partial [Propionibacteriaceae bacterium]|nr:alanine/ornithine racemase family PLP-dependent enzyme [Propionibacteriaceae bacterium]
MTISTPDRLGPRSPRVEIRVDRIRENARVITGLVASHGATTAGVGKVLRGHELVADALIEGGCSQYGDSRIANLAKVKRWRPEIETMLLRIPEISRCHEVVEVADYSLNSSLDTLRALSAACVDQRRTHRAIIMVDLGDLREGVWADDLLDVVTAARALPGLEIAGIGANLACYGGVAPNPVNMGRLVELASECRRETGLALSMTSGGNSSALPMLASGQMPREVNHFRMGESIILGRNVLDRSPWPGTRQDAIQIVVEIVEIVRKPSVPIGERGQNAFGEASEFVDRGVRRRAIVNLGRQDAVVGGLTPEDPAMIILGASSDHLIIDVDDCAREFRVGDEIVLTPD